MILYNNNIVVPEYMGNLVRQWMTTGRICAEVGGRLYNYDSIGTVNVGSAGGVFNYNLGLTMPTRCIPSASWITGRFDTGSSYSASITASQMIRNGSLGTGQFQTTAGQGTVPFKYFGVGLQISVEENTSNAERTGYLSFSPNGWETSEFSSSDYLPLVSRMDTYNINIVQEGIQIAPPDDPGKLSFTYILNGINGVEATLSYGNNTVSFTGSAPGGPSTVVWDVPQPHILTTNAGTNNIDIIYLRVYHNGNWQNGNYTISPSSPVNVPSNGTVSVTITFSA